MFIFLVYFTNVAENYKSQCIQLKRVSWLIIFFFFFFFPKINKTWKLLFDVHFEWINVFKKIFTKIWGYIFFCFFKKK